MPSLRGFGIKVSDSNRKKDAISISDNVILFHHTGGFGLDRALVDISFTLSTMAVYF